ncbi:flagellar hook-basal body complex protein FliE [Nocardioides sp. T2.26MG-1]|uniref:flagellar hook-basal body complex protein FliE n=1 Tax=Nocardioides sp. T2.26MG-1 TaxID=3041166 RepID=UPI0024773C4E|nr:flagellar hook-basal body complex protein FliE [Nocardioides sp. T2.26MG-1]CAI9399269.1 Flagellar hook-basal body complex protein FliE [Nocardioides sp. T2.26MG-1]
MSINAIEAIGGFTPTVAPQLTGAQTIHGSSKVDSSFGDLVIDGLDRLEAVQDRSDQLAVKAATGDLDDIHDYTIASTEAAVTTQLTVAVRNRALEAFNEIMRMPIG